MAAESIPSAIAVPETVPELTSRASDLKRGPSEEPEQGKESKRQRISPGKSTSPQPKDEDDGAQDSKDGGAATSQNSADPRQSRRKTSVADEKQRSKRLFGALLGNLNQPGDSRTTKRRQEIESRKKAELQRQDDERAEDRQRKQDEMAETKKREQERIDEENMQLRHRNMLETANFLQTKIEPRLHYRPWDLRPDEERRIEEQVKDAQAQIDRELDSFEQRYGRKAQSDVRSAKLHPDSIAVKDLEVASARNAGNEPVVEDQASAKSTTVTSEALKPAEVPDSNDNATNPNTNSPSADNKGNVDPDVHIVKPEEEADQVVDGEEDTVIY